MRMRCVSGRSCRLIAVVSFLPLLLLPACSKSARIMRYLKQAEASMLQGDLHLNQGRLQEAEGAYSKVEKLVARVLEVLPSSSPYAEKADELGAEAQHKRDSVRDPEGSVLAMIDAMRGTKFEDFKLIGDLPACVELAIGTDAWDGLGAQGQERLRGCVDAAIEHWLQTRVEALKLGQPRIVETAMSQDGATVRTAWRSTFGEVEMIFEVHPAEGRWKVFNFRIPVLDVGLLDYFRKTLEFMVEGDGALAEVLALPEAKERCIQAFERAEQGILDVDDSVVGKTVTLKGDPGTYQVAKQSTRENGIWILVRPLNDTSGSNLKWIPLSDSQVVEAEAQVWGMQ